MARKKQMPEDNREPTKILTKEPDAKDAAVKYLKSKGYDSWITDGVVMCLWTTETTFNDVTELLKKIGYNSSYGVVGTRIGGVNE